MKLNKEVWGFDVTGKRGINYPNDFAVGTDTNDNVCIKLGDQLIFPTMPTISKVEPYLYKAYYNTYNYEDAEEYFKNAFPVPFGACSSVIKGDFYGRNYDWYYDRTASFELFTTANQGRHATMGHSAIPMITDEIANSGSYNPYYAILPFYTLDGVNDHHVGCNLNVLPVGDKAKTVGTNPGKPDMCLLMVVRYILDYANSADHAIELLKELNLYSAYSETFQEEFHLMVGDPTKTIIVEFVDGYENGMHIMSNVDDGFDNIPNDLPIMTNFYLTDWNGEGLTVMGGATEDEVRETGLTDHAMGVERYNVLANGYENVTNLDTMAELMKSVWYTKTYSETENPVWYTEMVGNYKTYGDMTIYKTADDYAPIMEYVRDLYEHRSDADRDKNNLWQTVCSCIYDLKNLKMYIYSQENNTGYVYKMSLDGTI